MKKLILTLSAVCVCTLAMAQQSRLITKATWFFYNGAMIPGDSTSYQYNGTMGFDSLMQKWKCDTAIVRQKSGTTWGYTTRISNTYDAQGRLTEEFTEGLNAAGTIATPALKRRYTYNAQNKVTDFEYYYFQNGAWVFAQKATTTYNAQGKVIENIRQIDNGAGVLDNYTRTVFTYNASGDSATTTYYKWNNMWELDRRYTYYYTGAYLTSTLLEQFNAGPLLKDSTIFTLNANGAPIQEETKEYNPNTATWGKFTNVINTYDARGNKTNSILQRADMTTNGNYQNAVQTTITYNSNNHPLIEMKKGWNTTTNRFEFDFFNGNETHYYYEKDTTTFVKDLPVSKGNVHIYPIPAKDKITLELSWNDAQPAAILLYDMTGKLAAQWTTPSAKQHTQTLDVSSIPSGTYMLKVAGLKGVLSRQVNIVR